MAIKIPPPPDFAQKDPVFNRWLIELTSILNNDGTIDPGNITGLAGAIAAIVANTASINALNTLTATQTIQISSLFASVTALNNSVIVLNSEVATLTNRNQVLSGSGAPAAGLGNSGDWYGDTTAKHIYIKTGGVWTLIV